MDPTRLHDIDAMLALADRLDRVDAVDARYGASERASKRVATGLIVDAGGLLAGVHAAYVRAILGRLRGRDDDSPKRV